MRQLGGGEQDTVQKQDCGLLWATLGCQNETLPVHWALEVGVSCQILVALHQLGENLFNKCNFTHEKHSISVLHYSQQTLGYPFQFGVPILNDCRRMDIQALRADVSGKGAKYIERN